MSNRRRIPHHFLKQTCKSATAQLFILRPPKIAISHHFCPIRESRLLHHPRKSASTTYLYIASIFRIFDNLGPGLGFGSLLATRTLAQVSSQVHSATLQRQDARPWVHDLLTRALLQSTGVSTPTVSHGASAGTSGSRSVKCSQWLQASEKTATPGRSHLGLGSHCSPPGDTTQRGCLLQWRLSTTLRRLASHTALASPLCSCHLPPGCGGFSLSHDTDDAGAFPCYAIPFRGVAHAAFMPTHADVRLDTYKGSPEGSHTCRSHGRVSHKPFW
jgi:hypothetical protein